MTSRPFYMPDPTWWPTIADALPKPWPREAIEHDLVWWADQVSVGRASRLPGATVLARRWGLSRNCQLVREVLGYTVTPVVVEVVTTCDGVGADASLAQSWRSRGAVVAQFSGDSDDCTSPADAAAAHLWRISGASLAQSCDGQNDEVLAFTAEPEAAPRARGTETHKHINTYITTPPIPPEGVDGPAVGGPTAPPPATAPRPAPARPPRPPPTPTPGECQNDRRPGRINLAVLAKPTPNPIPEPDEVPDYELAHPLRPAETVALPGTLDELLVDARGMGRDIIGILRTHGIATTRELFERLAADKVQYSKGLSGARGQELVQHLGTRWGVFLRTQEDLEGLRAREVYAAAQADEASAKARADLKIVGGAR